MWKTIAILLVLCLTMATGRAEQKPNIIVLLADDLGYGELGCQGNPQIPTPHIDSLARDGVRLESGYVTASYCSPSRAGLLTGRLQSRFGYDMNPTGRRNLASSAGLPETEVTFVRQLQVAGYQTALIGKWHLGATETKKPLRRGFDRFFGFLHEGHYFVPAPYEGVTTFLRKKQLPDGASGSRIQQGDTFYSNHMGHDEPLYDDHNPIFDGDREINEAAYLTDAFTREATKFIDLAVEQSSPFFLLLSYNAVHSPMQGASEYMKRFESIEDVHRRIFAAMLSNLDDSVGQVLRTLHVHGIDNDTLVIFLSDNGGPTKELTSSNAPLRGGKGSLYEGGIRVPFLWRWNDVIPRGLVYDRPIIATDIAATIRSAAGIQNVSDSDGVDVVPYLAGKAGRPHETLYWRMNRQTALRKGDWKIVRPRGSNRFELYHLGSDIAETKDLSSENGEILGDLMRHWMAIDTQMRDPLPRPEPPQE